MAKYIAYRQFDEMDCGPTCLRMVAKFYGANYSREEIAEMAHLSNEGVSIGGLAEAAERIGLETLAVTTDFETLCEKAPLPCIAYWKQQHFIVVYEIKKKKRGGHAFVIADPRFGILSYSDEEMKKGWFSSKTGTESSEGTLLLLEPTPAFHQKEGDENVSTGSVSYLSKYFKPYRRAIFQVFLGLFIGSLVQLIFPFLTQNIVDYGISYRDYNFIYLILTAQIILFLSNAFVQIIRNWILLQVTSRINIRLISTFLMKLMRLPIAFHETKSIGDIMQRIDDHRRVQNFLSNATLNSLFSVFNIVVFSAILLYYQKTIFVIFIVGAGLYILWTLLFLKKRAELDFKRFDQASGNQSSTIQLINAMQEIKLKKKKKRRRWEWEAIQIRLFQTSMQSLTISQRQTIGSSLINELKNILITFISATAVIEGQMTLGMMISVQYIVGQINMPLANIVSFIQTTQDAKISLERIKEIHDQTNEEKGSNELISELPVSHELAAKNLSFRYGARTSAKILDQIDLQIPQGKVTAIVGESGSGKTTLVKLLLKFYDTYEGDLLIGGKDLKRLSSSYWRSKCGCVMQDGYIFADSIVRNISESDSAGLIDKEKLANAIRIANLEAFIDKLPTGLNTRIGSSGMKLSGGQMQRILIARAVYKDPEFLFFDEATSALDANNELQIMKNLNDFFVGKTAIIVAHRLSTVKNADNIIVLNQGRIVEQGNHADLTQKKGKYYELVKNQLELGS